MILLSKSLSVVAAIAVVLNSDSAISIGCAIAIVGVVWTAGRKLKGYEDKIDAIGPRIDALEQKVQKLTNERAFDLDTLSAETMRAEMIGNLPAPEFHWRLLIVDDNVADRKLIRRAMRRCEIDEVGTLTAALELLKNNSYDCVVLDLNLPDCDRTRTVPELLRAHPAAICVAISGYEDPNLSAQAVAAGANSFMLKSSDDKYIARMIQHAISRSTLRKLDK